MIGAESVLTANLAKEAITAVKLGAEVVETAKIKLLAVTEALLGPEAVSEAKIKKGAVSAAKLAAPSAKPAKPAEGATTLAAPSPARKVTAAIVGNGAKKEWVIEHGLETRLVEVAVQIGEGEEPAEVESSSNYKVRAISGKAVEVVFTTAPAAKALLYVTVVG